MLLEIVAPAQYTTLNNPGQNPYAIFFHPHFTTHLFHCILPQRPCALARRQASTMNKRSPARQILTRSTRREVNQLHRQWLIAWSGRESHDGEGNKADHRQIGNGILE